MLNDMNMFLLCYEPVPSINPLLVLFIYLFKIHFTRSSGCPDHEKISFIFLPISFSFFFFFPPKAQSSADKALTFIILKHPLTV